MNTDYPMPTENRSSNTELSKIVTEALVGMVSGVTGMKPPTDEPLPGFVQAPIDRAVERIAGFLAQPAEQHQGEPVAWCQPHWSGKYADYSWGAERPNAAFPELWEPLYTHADPGEVERLKSAAEHFTGVSIKAAEEVSRLRAQLAELVSAVRSINFGPSHAIHVRGDDEPSYLQRKEWIEWLLGLCDAASAGSSAPNDCAICRDLGTQCMECE